MAIQLKCNCGKTLNLKDEFGGKTIRCPGCKQPLKVPAAGGAAASPAPGASPAPAMMPGAPSGRTAAGAAGGLGSLFDEEGMGPLSGPVCPACAKEVRPGTVICINCGFNMQTGHKLQGHSQTLAAASEFGNADLDRAAAHMRRDAQVQKQIAGTGMPWWMLLIILLIVAALAVIGVFISNAIGAEGELDSRIPRLMLAIIMVVIDACMLYFGIRILIVAFNESVSQGFMAMLIPFYIFIYAFSRPLAKPFAMPLVILNVMAVVIGVGVSVIFSLLGI